MAEKRLTVKDFRDPARRTEVIPWPGTEREVAILCPLTCGELQRAHFASVDHFRRAAQPFDGAHGLFAFEVEKDRQELALMVLQPGSRNPKDRLFVGADEVRDVLDPEDVAYFQNAYRALRARQLAAEGRWPAGRDLPELPFKR